MKHGLPYVGATALAVVAPRVAALGYLVIAVVAILRARGDEGPSARGPGETDVSPSAPDVPTASR